RATIRVRKPQTNSPPTARRPSHSGAISLSVIGQPLPSPNDSFHGCVHWLACRKCPALIRADTARNTTFGAPFDGDTVRVASMSDGNAGLRGAARLHKDNEGKGH